MSTFGFERLSATQKPVLYKDCSLIFHSRTPTSSVNSTVILTTIVTVMIFKVKKLQKQPGADIADDFLSRPNKIRSNIKKIKPINKMQIQP
jgi:hypothetical protein